MKIMILQSIYISLTGQRLQCWMWKLKLSAVET